MGYTIKTDNKIILLEFLCLFWCENKISFLWFIFNFRFCFFIRFFFSKLSLLVRYLKGDKRQKSEIIWNSIGEWRMSERSRGDTFPLEPINVNSPPGIWTKSFHRSHSDDDIHVRITIPWDSSVCSWFNLMCDSSREEGVSFSNLFNSFEKERTKQQKN